MTILDEVLSKNESFVETFEGEELSHHPQKKLAILTCMDCRLVDFLEPALGLKRWDAKIIRNAGNSIVGEDVIRSIAVALYGLGAEEVMVVGHTQCGMAHVDIKALKSKMIESALKNGIFNVFGGLKKNIKSFKNFIGKTFVKFKKKAILKAFILLTLKYNQSGHTN